MLVDARSIPPDSTLETDVCIVGAGAAGIALARELAGASPRVILLESGGFEAEAETQALYGGRIYGRAYFRLDSARTRRFGGSTHCWHGLCRPLDAIDFEARDWVPHSGWPFGLEELRPYYARAQALCRLGAFDYRGADWADARRPLLPFEGDALRTGVFQVSPLRFGEVYRQELVAAPSVQTQLHANVVEIEADESAGRVDAVRVASLEGNRFRVRARLFVLATGGIENARLLLASNRRQPRGLGNRHDLVGRFFMEHPHVVAGAFLPSSGQLPLGLYRPHRSGGLRVSAYLAPSEATLRDERTLNFTSFLDREAPLPEFEQGLASAIHQIDEGHIGERAPRKPAKPARSEPKASEVHSKVIFFMNECEQAPNPESRVRLTEARDALGMPRVQLEWRLGSLDKRSIRRGHELLARELGRAGIGRLQMMLSDDDYGWPPELQGGRHHMGTTRMHTDPRQGVVDADAKVHGLENLYVAGSSVFPTGGAADPTLTLLALALRLADHLKERLA